MGTLASELGPHAERLAARPRVYVDANVPVGLVDFMRERLGWGTLLNAIEIGFVVLLIDDHLPHTDRLVPRLAYVVGAVLVVAIGSGLYIGAGLGPGPRDGLMLGLAVLVLGVFWRKRYLASR